MPKSACPAGRGAASARLAQRVVRATACFDDGARRVARRAHVELHLDVGAEQALHAHGLLGRQRVRRAVEVGLEREALLGRRDERAHRRSAVESEYAWKPPESVSIACGQRVNACSPPSAAMASAPGRSNRWYVLPRTMRAPVDGHLAGVSVLTLPCVPTGMNVGVSTGPCGVSSTARRALAVAREDAEREARRAAGSTASPEEHRVAVREEAVAPRPRRDGTRRARARRRRTRRPARAASSGAGGSS